MAGSSTPRSRNYKSPPHAQVWFLCRSRDLWKSKHQALKAEHKRLQNRVRDVSKSRDAWRIEAEQLRHRVRELEAQVAAESEKKIAGGS